MNPKSVIRHPSCPCILTRILKHHRIYVHSTYILYLIVNNKNTNSINFWLNEITSLKYANIILKNTKLGHPFH